MNDEPVKGESFFDKSRTGYVGLVNSGATCYLNSLLQSLYMTPEFRRALFQWEYDEDQHGDTKFCIPFQLQLLFSRLTHSVRGAISTKDLTTSFRWSSHHLFQQQDVSEMMNQLFKAMDRVIKMDPEKNKTFIQSLYHGSTMDYLKCTKCDYHRETPQTFQEINLNIEGVETLQAALDKYVDVTMLDGDNQYRCSTCNKKVDAKKGLRFQSLPTILCITLKRFVYDWERDCRVKINSKMIFPFKLDMNPYLTSSSPSNNNEKEVGSNTLDNQYVLCAALIHAGVATRGHYFAYIRPPPCDIRITADSSHMVPATDLQLGGKSEPNDCENIQDSCDIDDSKTNYERKENSFEEDQALGDNWFEFNDSSVSQLPRDNPLKLAYGDNKSNASAYMLIYRRTTAQAVKIPSLPANIQAEIDQDNAEYAKRKAEREEELRTLYFHLVYDNKTHRFSFDRNMPFEEAVKSIYESLKIRNEGIPFDCVRIRHFEPALSWSTKVYDHVNGYVLQSTESSAPKAEGKGTEVAFGDTEKQIIDKGKNASGEGNQTTDVILPEKLVTLEDFGFRKQNNVLLETKETNAEWPIYNPNLIPVRIHLIATKEEAQKVVDCSDWHVSCPHPSMLEQSQEQLLTVYVDKTRWLIDLKHVIAESIDIKNDDQRLIRLHHNRAECFDDDTISLKTLDIGPGSLLFLETISLESNDRKDGGKGMVAMSEGFASSPLLSAFELKRLRIIINFNLIQSVQDGSVDDVEDKNDSKMSIPKDRDPDEYSSDVKSSRVVDYSQSIPALKTFTLLQVKEAIAPVVGLRPHEFRLRRSVNSDLLKDEGRTLESLQMIDGSVLYVEKGPPLTEGEYLLKVFLYEPSARPKKGEKQFISLFEHPFHKDILTSQLKVQLKQLLDTKFSSPPILQDNDKAVILNEGDTIGGDLKINASKCPSSSEDGGIVKQAVKDTHSTTNSFGIEFMRIRVKPRARKGVGKIFEEAATLKQMMLRLNDGDHITLEKVDEPEAISKNDASLFIREFFRDSRKFGRKKEIIINKRARLGHLKQQIKKHSKSRIENLGIAKGRNVSRNTPASVSKLEFGISHLEDKLLVRLPPLSIRPGDLVFFCDTSVELSKKDSMSKSPSRRVGRRKPKFTGVPTGRSQNTRKEVGVKIFTQEDIDKMNAEAELRASEMKSQQEEADAKLEADLKAQLKKSGKKQQEIFVEWARGQALPPSNKESNKEESSTSNIESHLSSEALPISNTGERNRTTEGENTIE